MEEQIWAVVKLYPVLGGVAFCVVVALFLRQKGLITIGKVRKSDTASGRWRTKQVLDTIQLENHEIPEVWRDDIDARVIHKTNNILQEKVFPIFETHRARLERLEPIVSELRQDSKETHDSVVRLEEIVGAIRESQTEMKNDVIKLRDAVLVAIAGGKKI